MSGRVWKLEINQDENGAELKRIEMEATTALPAGVYERIVDETGNKSWFAKYESGGLVTLDKLVMTVYDSLTIQDFDFALAKVIFLQAIAQDAENGKVLEGKKGTLDTQSDTPLSPWIFFDRKVN